MGRLTKRGVEAAQPKAAPYYLWCDGLKGFGVRVHPTGRKTFCVDYTAKDTGKRRRMKLGDYGVLTVEQARQMAADHRHEVIKGADPILARQERKSELTVAHLCTLYLEACDNGLIFGKQGRPKKASTILTDRSRIGAHITPLLGARRLSDLTRPDVVRFVSDVTSGKAARDIPTGKKGGRSIVRGGSGAAARTTALLGAIFEWGVNNGHMAINPAIGVRRPSYKKRTQRVTPAQYRQLGEALRDPAINIIGLQAVIIIALGGFRLSEVAALRWSEIDFENRQIAFGDSKTGASIRPMSISLRTFLLRIEKTTDSDFVFPARRKAGSHHKGIFDAVNKIYDSANIPGLRSHILRHGLGSVGANAGYTRELIGLLLGHAPSGTTSVYMHFDRKVILRAADAIADIVEEQMDIGDIIHL